MFIEAFLFFLGVEFWKWCKRVYFRRKAKGAVGAGNEDAESKMFARYLSIDSKGSSDLEKA